MSGDPIENIVAAALSGRGVAFVRDGNDSGIDTKGLDFRLMGVDVYIECKQFHTQRTTEQMSRVDNVIAIQGRAAAEMFAEMLKR